MIDGEILWKQLGSTMSPDTFHLWNIFQSKIAKERNRVDELERESTELRIRMSDRLENLEKRLNGTK